MKMTGFRPILLGRSGQSSSANKGQLTQTASPNDIP